MRGRSSSVGGWLVLLVCSLPHSSTVQLDATKDSAFSSMNLFLILILVIYLCELNDLSARNSLVNNFKA